MNIIISIVIHLVKRCTHLAPLVKVAISPVLAVCALTLPVFTYAKESQQCPIAYVDLNLTGSSYTMCPGSGDETIYTYQVRNDSISSIFINPNSSIAVEACEHVDGSGRCQTYFKTVLSIGTELNDTFSYFKVIRFSYDDFVKVISSDPQYPWACGKKNIPCNNRGQADLDNANQVASMNAIQADYGKSRVAGSIINGDLTAYGHNWQLAKYFQFYERDLRMNNYPGLGNHDYANNVNNTYENQDATRMMEYLINSVHSLNVNSFDYRDSGTYYWFPKLVRFRENSFGYSWDVGTVHFVQLHNYPTYTASWNGWNASEARQDYFNIHSSLQWLRNDLSQAYRSGKKIILNFHDWGDHSNIHNAEFVQILKDFKVAAIFAGHIHQSIGELQGYPNLHGPGRHLRVFRSGSVAYNNYLLARFLKNDMIINKVDSSNGKKYKLEPIGKFELQAGALRGEWVQSGGRHYSTKANNPHIQLTLKEATQVTIDLKSSIDTYLYVLDSSGRLVGSDDDGGEWYNSRLYLQLGAGTYTVVPATYWERQAGDFIVESSAGELGFSTLLSKWDNSAGSSHLKNHRNPSYLYTAPANATQVTFDLTSVADTFLCIATLHGSNFIACDDDSGAGRNARLTASVTGGKSYIVTAATYWAGETQPFRLKASTGTLR